MLLLLQIRKYNFPKQPEGAPYMDKELLRVIGENVKKYREKANLTQAELAEKIGIGTASVSRIERGEKRMKLETLRAFADALDISVGLLFYQENKNELILTLAKMLDGQSSEFIESIMALVRVCMENFEKKKTDSDDL